MAYKPKTIKDFFGYNIFRMKLTWQDMSANVRATSILLATISAVVGLFYLVGKFPAVMAGTFLVVLISIFICIVWMLIRSCIDD